jgi:DNA primase
VGWTARLLREGKPKYISEQQPGYVFNLDAQSEDKKFTFICEGPLDAISIEGAAIMGSEIQQGQLAFLNRIGTQLVVVPDRDKSCIKLVKQASELGMSVCFPEWDDGIKDVNDAVRKHGRLYTMYSIVNGIQNTPLKIEIAMKKWFKDDEEN